MRTKDLFRELAPDYSPKYDPWGHAMGVYFSVAEVLHFDYGITVPTYRPGPLTRGPDTEDYAYQGILELRPPQQDLERLARFLHRLTGRIERAGLSY